MPTKGACTYPDALGDLLQLLLVHQVGLVEDQAVREGHLTKTYIRVPVNQVYLLKRIFNYK